MAFRQTSKWVTDLPETNGQFEIDAIRQIERA